MQRLYWRPTRISRMVYVLIGLISVAGFVSVERLRSTTVLPHFQDKLEAARLMQGGMEQIRAYRVRNVAPIDLEVDPTNSGMLGVASSDITTNTGSLEAKRTTINPNWAAVVVDFLYQAGVRKGDTIAIGISGSFPALNLASFAAAEVMELEVISIASVGASSWGANIPRLTWLDMERLLNQKKVISHRSVAASLGGTRDRAIGMGKSGRRQLKQVIEKNGLEYIETPNDIESIEKRMEIYRLAANGRPISAYINVGGSLVSIGPKSVKRVYRPGLNLKLPPKAAQVDSVIKRFIRDGTPVVNLTKVVPLAESYGFPVEPEALPLVGEGEVYSTQEYNRWLVAGVLCGIVFSLFSLLRLNVGTRISSLRRSVARPIEPMV